MSIYRSFLRRPNPASPAVSPAVSATPQLSQDPNSGPPGSRYLPSIATPVPEGSLTSDQVNHIIECLQGIILNNGSGLSPNRGAARQLRPIPPAVGPACHHPTLTGHFIPTALEVDICTTEEGRTDIADVSAPTAPWGRVRPGRRIWLLWW